MSLLYCPYCMTPVEPNTPCPHCGLTMGSYHPAPHHLPPGTVLMDRYQLGRVLGEGGFGITYIGYDTRLDLRVAIKEYFPPTMVSRDNTVSLLVQPYNLNIRVGFEHGKERFLQEARAMGRMDKTPEIVAVRDFFEANSTAYIVMEYIDGTTFKQLVNQNGGPIPAEELLAMIKPLFGALDALHKENLIHRDISPDNIMLENGKVRLLDFGCAREALSGTETMTVMLKQGFSPIEQYQHKGQGPWTDVYSLAATIYYCITGQVPPQPLDRLTDNKLIPPRKLGANLTVQQERALLHAMQLNPPRRYRSIQEFYTALYEAEDNEQPEPEDTDDLQADGTDTEQGEVSFPSTETPGKTTDGPEKRNSNRRLIIGVGAAVVLLLIAILATVFRGRPQPPPNSTPSGQVETSEAPDSSAAPSAPSPTPNNPNVLVWNAEDFLTALEDEAVETIHIGQDSNITLDGALNLKKTLILDTNSTLSCGSYPATLEADCILREGAFLETYGDFFLSANLSIAPNAVVDLHGDTFTISAGGSASVDQGGTLGAWECGLLLLDGGNLTLDGDLYCGNLTRTRNGATITINKTGFAHLSNLWLQSARDLTGAGASNLDGYDIMVLDDTVFDNAVSVRTQEELDNAIWNSLAVAIRIDDSFTLDHGISLDKPMLLSEGVTLSGAEDACLQATDLLVVNGEMAANLDVYLGTCINNGTISSPVFTVTEGTMINQGNLIPATSGWEQASFLNLGQYRIGNGDGTPVYSGFASGRFWNTKSSTVAICNGTHMAMQYDLSSYNNGSVIIEKGATLQNNALLEGNVILAGIIENDGGALLRSTIEMDGGEIHGGLVVTDSSQQKVLEGQNTTVLYSVQDIDGLEAPNSGVFNRLVDGQKDIKVVGNLVVDGPLELHQSLVIEDGASLTVHGSLTMKDGASLNPRGLLTADELVLENCYLATGPSSEDPYNAHSGIHITSGGTLRLNNVHAELYGPIIGEEQGALLILENSSVLYNQNTIDGFDITINGSHLTNATSLMCHSLTLENGAVNAFSGIFVNSGTLTVDENSSLVSSSDLNMENAALDNRGTINVRSGDIHNSPTLVLVNQGYFELGSFGSGLYSNLDCVLNNHGALRCNGNTTVARIDNYGDLFVSMPENAALQITDQLNNQGHIILESGDINGNVSGNIVDDQR